MTEASKAILTNAAREWAKFTAERDKFSAVAQEVADLARRCVFESVTFLKGLNVEADAESPETMTIMKAAVHVDPAIEANFPNIKASVTMKCSGASRMILINPNLTVSAGGTPVAYEALKKGIPASFEANAADFVRDAFLYIARTGGKEQAT